MRRPSRSGLSLVIVLNTTISLAAQYVEFNGIEKLLSSGASLSTLFFSFSFFRQSSGRALYYSLNIPLTWLRVYAGYMSLYYPHITIPENYFLESDGRPTPEENSHLSQIITIPLFKIQ